MNSWERFSIGFVSSLLYPAIKVTQSSIDLTSFDAVFGGLLPCIFKFPTSVCGVLTNAFEVELKLALLLGTKLPNGN